MTRKILLVLPLLAAVGVGFAIGHLHPMVGASTARVPLYYVDSMHPAYRSSKPGIAPDCGMELTPVYADDLGKALPSVAATSGALHIDPAAQQLYGIGLAKVDRASAQETLRLFGRVAADETRVYRVDFGADGYVKETHGDAVGSRVRKDQHLATVYAPEFLSVAGGYLSANERSQSGGAGGMMKDNAAPTQNAASAQARADRLRILGMSDSQINELSTTRKIPEDVYVVSPADGVVLTRSISQGLRFERHTDLYTIADLSQVWILAQVTESDARALRPGTVAEVTLPDTNERLRARVSNVLPQIDAESHTLTIRLEARNPGLRMRPNMFVTVQFPVAHAGGLTVPSDAVLDSGLRKRVFVQTAEGVFEPREVETGWQHGDRVEIVKGLEGGEMIAASGTFLIDSESRMQLSSNAAGPGKGASREPHSGDPPTGELRR